MNLPFQLLQTTANQGYASMIMIGLMFVVFYFFMIRPQSKKQKELANFRKLLKINQQVITSGGIYGVVKEVNNTDVILEIANGVRIRVDKNSVYAAVSETNQAK